MNIDQLKLLRSAARVKRVHVLTSHHQQSVGEHTFGALALLFFIEPNVRGALIRALLHHDVAEAVTGDVPAPTKWKYPELKNALLDAERDIMLRHGFAASILTSHERRLLDYCDLMELALYSCEEIDIGNVTFGVILNNCLSTLYRHDLVDVTPIAKELYEFMLKRAEATYSTDLGRHVLCGLTGAS